MPSHRDHRARIQELQESGFDSEQGERYEFILRAGKLGVVALICAIAASG